VQITGGLQDLLLEVIGSVAVASLYSVAVVVVVVVVVVAVAGLDSVAAAAAVGEGLVGRQFQCLCWIHNP
jgi:hypothetical protein